jgi:2-C-methyl-D-erythritol 4-phosphate cytidylyltransferase
LFGVFLFSINRIFVSSMLKKSVIITAGGIGKRMGTELPKQFLLIKGKPIIFHTIQKFLDFDSAIEVIVVLPESSIPFWETLCQKYLFAVKHKVVSGGEERFHSIQNGLMESSGDIVAVHDAVRPCVSADVIKNCFDAAEKLGGAIPVLAIAESLRKIERENSIAVNRDDYKIVQTPQCFKIEILQKAYQQRYSKLFTDDASVVEAAGQKIHLVEGNRENIKITTPEDLKWAELFIG